MEGQLPSSHQHGAQQNWRLPTLGTLKHLTHTLLTPRKIRRWKDKWTKDKAPPTSWSCSHLDEEARNCPPYSKGCGNSSTKVQPHLAQMTTRYEGHKEKPSIPWAIFPVQCCTKIFPLRLIFFWKIEEIYSAKSSGLMRRSLAF